MHDLVEIQVECHSGYKADEYPVRFYWDNIVFEIIEILDRWYQGNVNPDFQPANYFKVRTSDNKTFILKNSIENDHWYLWIKGETVNL